MFQTCALGGFWVHHPFPASRAGGQKSNQDAGQRGPALQAGVSDFPEERLRLAPACRTMTLSRTTTLSGAEPWHPPATEGRFPAVLRKQIPFLCLLLFNAESEVPVFPDLPGAAQGQKSALALGGPPRLLGDQWGAPRFPAPATPMAEAAYENFMSPGAAWIIHEGFRAVAVGADWLQRFQHINDRP